MKYPSQIQLEAKERKGNKVVALSGRVTRNMDWFSGKHFRFIPSGIRLQDYQNNPILLWSHNAHSLNSVLGTADVTLENDKLVAEPTFHQASDESRLAKKLWDMGVLNAVSVRVGFTAADMEKFVEGEREIVITAGELQELSIVTIPADPGAVREAALSLGIEPKRATQILMEVNMDEDTVLDEGIELGDDSGGPVFSPEEQVEFAVMLTTNEAAFHIMRDAFMAEVRLEYETQISELRGEIAELRGEPVRRQQVTPAPRRSLFGNEAKERAATLSAPPANIRQPQRNEQATKPANSAGRWAERTAAKRK